MNKFMYALGLLLGLTFFAPKPTVFAQGKEESFWPNGNPKVLGYYDRKHYKDREWKEWYENGQLKKSEFFLKGRRSGLVTEYYENGQLKYSQNYRPDADFNGSIIVDGLWTEYHPDGQKLKEGKFLNGAREGLWTEWHPNGEIRTVETLQNNKRTGPFQEFYEDGFQKAKGNYVANEKRGIWEEWYQNGQLIKKETFNDAGKLEGAVTTFYANGQQKTAGTYRSSAKMGQWNEWYENGNPKLAAFYQDAAMIGPYMEWHENGAKSLEATYADRKMHGSFQEWFDNGQLKTQGKYDAGLKDETWRYFDASGTKTKETVYKNGKKVAETAL